MSGDDAPDVPIDALYDANAEYYDLITGDRFAQLAAVVDGWTPELDVEVDLPVLDIGAGTGRMTRHLARRLAPRPVVSVEPSRGLRAVLVTRLMDDGALADRVTVLPLTLAEALPHLPERIAGGVAFGMVPHLSPAERRQLLEGLAERLDPGGSLLLEVMPPYTADPVPLTPMGTFTSGGHVIDCTMQAEQTGASQLEWTMRYRRSTADGTVLHETAVPSSCWVVDPDTVRGEAADAGLDCTAVTDDILRLSPHRVRGR